MARLEDLTLVLLDEVYAIVDVVLLDYDAVHMLDRGQGVLVLGLDRLLVRTRLEQIRHLTDVLVLSEIVKRECLHRYAGS